MGTCNMTPCVPSSVHPVLGSVQHVTLMDRKLIKMVDFSLTKPRLKNWESSLQQLERENPKLRKLLFLPAYHQEGEACGLGPCVQFYFQNYKRNLDSELKDTQSKILKINEEIIRNLGKKLFELMEACPDLEEDLTLENIMLNDEGNIKIALKKYMPQSDNIELNPPSTWSMKSAVSQKTDDTTSPRISLRNVEYRKINLLNNTCAILLSLVEKSNHYSSSFQGIIKKMKLIEKDYQLLRNYFLGRSSEAPKNFLLDKNIIEDIHEKSQDTSLFMVTESGWSNNNTISFYT